MSSVVFEIPTGNTATGATLSSNRSSVCFSASKAFGVRSTTAITQGPNSFYYFEARRSTMTNLSVGVAGHPTDDPGTGELGPSADSLVANFMNTLTRDGSGNTQYGQLGGPQDVLGYAVDYRGKFPVVYVIGNAGSAGACPSGLTGNVPCVFSRVQLADSTGSLYIYAYGNGDGASPGPMVSINTGSNLLVKPYAHSQAGVRKALRAAFYQGDRGLNPQWPSASGPVPLPALTRAGTARAVVRLGDATPYTTAFSASAGGNTAAIQWSDENGITRGTGGTLALSPTLLAALGAGAHQLIAGVTDPVTGLYAELSYQLTIDAAGTNLDDDGDGLSYDQEQAASTDPANADTDGDGLSDGAEGALGFNPLAADSGNTLPRLSLVMETGAYATPRGIVLSDDGLSAAFTSDVNQDCLQRKGVYADPDFAEVLHCYKRAVRANGGIRQGEFRYFETHRLAGTDNLGFGIITANSMIDPYCCFNNTQAPTPPAARTPPSMSLNAAGGTYVQLVGQPGFNASATTYYGFAVDYTGANPVVYVVTTDAVGGMVVQSLAVPGFNGVDAIPFMYGNPLSDTEPRGAINFGLQHFHYDTAALRTALGSLGANVSQFRPGVGPHRQP